MALFVIHRGTGTILNAWECELIIAESSEELDDAVYDDDVDDMVRLASSVVKITDLIVPNENHSIAETAAVEAAAVDSILRE